MKKRVCIRKWILVVMAALLLCVGCGEAQEQMVGDSVGQVTDDSPVTSKQTGEQKKSQQEAYEEAMEAYNAANYSTALELFTEAGAYEDAANYVEQCNYKLAYLMLQDGKHTEAMNYMQQVTSQELWAELDEQYQLSLGKAAMEAGNYEEALGSFEKVKDYTKKAEWLDRIAEHYIELKDTSAAQKVIQQIQLGNAAKAAELQKELKYVLYADEPFPVEDEYTYAYKKSEMESVEEMVSLFYGTWYNHETGTMKEITETTLGGRPYYVYSVYSTYSGTILFFGYMNEPGKQYGIQLEGISFVTGEYGGVENWEYIAALNDCSWYADGLEASDIYMYNVEKWRYEELCEAQDDYYYGYLQSQEGNYSKEQVYAAAKEEFQNWLDSCYSLTEQLYMKVQYQSVDEASFYYDSSMSSYEIRFEVTVNANIFDFFGTSTTTYVVQAEYYESSWGLKAAMFNIY